MTEPPKPPLSVGPEQIAAVAGLDTGSGKMHLYCNNGYRAHLRIPDRPKIDVDERRHRLFDHARLAFSMLPHNTLIVCEEPLALQNGKTTRVLALAAGAIWSAHLDCSVFWVWADVTAWKKTVMGNGNSSKDEIQAWVRQNMGLEFPEDELDYWDAAALCRYGELQLGLPGLT